MNNLTSDIQLHITKPELVTRVWEYVREMETQQTNKWCMCEWIVHPEDVKVPEGVCRLCGQQRDYITHKDTSVNIGPTLDAMYDKHVTGPNQHPFAGRRQRRGEAHIECPVHTKEGFLLGFFKWLIERTPPPNPETLDITNRAGQTRSIPLPEPSDYFPNRGD